MIKKSLFILLAVYMLWSIPVLAAQDVLVEGMTYTSGGQRVTAIPAGAELTAEIKVTNQSGKQQNSMFSMVLYQDGKIQGVNVDSKALENEETYTYTARLAMPADPAGCTVRTVLWDGFDNMQVRYSGSIFPNSEPGLKKLFVDGKPVDSLSGIEINVSIPVTQRVAPVVEAVPLDGGTSLTMQPPVKFPGKTVISAVAADGTEQTYTINYQADGKLVDNLKFIAEGLPETQVKEWNLPSRLALGENLDNKSGFYADRAATALFYENIAEELKGCYFIQTALDWPNGGSAVQETINAFKQAEAIPWISFDIYRTSVVRVLSDRELPSFKQGQWNTGDPATGWRLNKAPGFWAQRMLNQSVNANLAYIYEKTFPVEDGQSLTVVIPNACVGGFPYTVLIDPIYQ